MKVSEKIYYCRRKQGLSQEALAAQLNVSRQAVSKWETGDAEPESGKLVVLAQIFGVSVDWLLSGDDQESIEIGEERIQTSAGCPASQQKMTHHAVQNLRFGYLIYLGCFFTFLFFAICARFCLWPSFSCRIDFGGLAHFFDPITLSAMLIGCVLLLYGSRLLHPITQAFRFMVFRQDYENGSAVQIGRCRHAVWTALAGWILGGLLYAVIFTMNDCRNMSLPADSVEWVGSLLAVHLNVLLYSMIACFILFPVVASLKEKRG